MRALLFGVIFGNSHVFFRSGLLLSPFGVLGRPDRLPKLVSD